MNLLFSINKTLPENTTIVAVERALQLIREVLHGYETMLHGSWFLDLSFNDSDIDLAVIAPREAYYKVKKHLERELAEHPTDHPTDHPTEHPAEHPTDHASKYLRIRKCVVNADVRTINIEYCGDSQSLEIDISIQPEENLVGVQVLKRELDAYEFHDLYRALKIILASNHLYGHKVGGLNSFSICWMIFAMIKYYEQNSNLLDLEPQWFGRTDDESHLYNLVVMFCKFYTEISLRRQMITINHTPDGVHIELKRLQLSFDNWRDCKQPWLLRLHLDIVDTQLGTYNLWVTEKAWRYNHILALFHSIASAR